MQVKVINKSSYALPEYKTPGSAGMDVRADIPFAIELMPGERGIIPTGLYPEIPEGLEIQVRPRSGLAALYGVTVINSPGTIDSDFRGEMKVILINHDPAKIFKVVPGERIGQLVLSKVEFCEWVETKELADSERGQGGFGHTGQN